MGKFTIVAVVAAGEVKKLTRELSMKIRAGKSLAAATSGVELAQFLFFSNFETMTERTIRTLRSRIVMDS